MYGLVSLPLVAVTSLMRYNYNTQPTPTATGANGSGSSSSSNDEIQQQTQQPGASGAAPAVSGAAAESGAANGNSRNGSGSSGSQLSQLLVQPAVLVFLWRCLLLGLGLGVMSNYEFLWLKQLGAPEALMGFALAVRRGGG